MVLNNISSKISFLTKSDTTSYANTDRLVNINAWYRNVVALILQYHDDWTYDDSNRTDYPILTNNLIANQQDYQLPVSTLLIRRMEVTYDGTNWKRVTAFDIGSRDASIATNAISGYSTNKPYYDLQYGSVFLYPIPTANITGGIKIWVERGPQEFTSSDLTTGSLEPGFDSLFHEILVYGPSYDYAVANNLPNRDVLKARSDELMKLMINHYSSKDKDITYSMQADYQSMK